jgi:hypothetical protein
MNLHTRSQTKKIRLRFSKKLPLRNTVFSDTGY